MLRRYFQIQRTPSKSCFTRPQSKNRDSIPLDTMTKLSQTVRSQGVGNGTLLALKSAKQNALQLFNSIENIMAQYLPTIMTTGDQVKRKNKMADRLSLKLRDLFDPYFL